MRERFRAAGAFAKEEINVFGKLMNSYYYGKSGKGDYRKEDMPHNRWQLFWEMFRVRFFVLVKLNFAYMLCWIPAMAVLAMTGLSMMNQFAAMVPETGALDSQMMSEIMDMLNSMLYTGLVLLAPCVAITGPFTAGMTYVVRNWARDEHSFIWSDFKDAMKDNWKQALVVSVVTGVIPVLVYICWNFYGSMTADSMFMMLPQMLVLLVLILWMLALPYFYPLMITYKLKLRDLFRNALLMGVARLPMNVALRLGQAVPIVICLIVTLFVSPMWGPLAMMLYYMCIGFTLSRFVSVSYVQGVFDKFINSKMEGVEVNRGIYQDPDDEDDEDEEDAE